MSKKQRRQLANRLNAQKSCGPVTPEGKAKVSQNRTVHGLTGAFHLLPNEDPELFDQLLNQLIVDEAPIGIAEIELVKKMAEHSWCAERATRLMDACFIIAPQSPEQIEAAQAEMVVRPELERYMRYQAHHNREYARAANELLRRRKERRIAAAGFESQKRAAAREQRCANRENRQVERQKYFVASAATTIEPEISLAEAPPPLITEPAAA